MPEEYVKVVGGYKSPRPIDRGLCGPLAMHVSDPQVTSADASRAVDRIDRRQEDLDLGSQL